MATQKISEEGRPDADRARADALQASNSSVREELKKEQDAAHRNQLAAGLEADELRRTLGRARESHGQSDFKNYENEQELRKRIACLEDEVKQETDAVEDATVQLNRETTTLTEASRKLVAAQDRANAEAEKSRAAATARASAQNELGNAREKSWTLRHS